MTSSLELRSEPSETAHDSHHLQGYAIDIEGVSASSGHTPMLRNLSMHVPRGSIYGLVGPAGAGKTTVIRIVATLQEPDEGSVLVDGIDVRGDPRAARARIGYMPDFAGVYEGLTVAEYMDFYAEIHRIPARRRRQLSDELLELVGLAEQRQNSVGRLSRAMKQQLSLARSLIHDPPILLLDEPASGLAPRDRLDMREFLLELQRLEKTILLASHMLSELAETCTHLGILRAGTLVAEGYIDEIVDAISPDARLHIRLLDAASRDTAARLLEAHPECRKIEAREPSSLLLQFNGTDRDLPALLEQLNARGVRVAEFALEPHTLEEVFLQVSEMSGP